MTEFTQIFNPKFQQLQNNIYLAGNLKSITTEAGNYGPFRKKTRIRRAYSNN